MLMIRLQRFGRKNDPNFRVVLTDKRNATKSGKFLEILGFYNPKTKAKKIEGERVKYWISKGAKLSATANNLLLKEKVIIGKAINVVPKPKAKPVEPEKVPAEEKTPPTPANSGIGAPSESAGVDNQVK